MRSIAYVVRLVVSLFVVLLRISIEASAITYEQTALESADQCDWNGSGGGGRGVRPVYLRCSRGTVFWRYPRGALRVVLSPPALTDLSLNSDLDHAKHNRSHPSKNENKTGFRACTKVSGPVRVYLETNGQLRAVYSPRDGKHQASHRCFYVKKQPAAFYIEAEESTDQDANLQYDLELRTYANFKGNLKLNQEEEEEDCRPCSMDELAKAYCQSDLVARGTVSAVQRQLDLDAAELIVGIVKTLRQIEENEGNDIDVDSHDRKSIRVRVPTACDARHGQGEFVIMAKRRLGDLVLVCAPRLETWAKTVRELKSAPCVLRS